MILYVFRCSQLFSARLQLFWITTPCVMHNHPCAHTFLCFTATFVVLMYPSLNSNKCVKCDILLEFYLCSGASLAGPGCLCQKSNKNKFDHLRSTGGHWETISGSFSIPFGSWLKVQSWQSLYTVNKFHDAYSVFCRGLLLDVMNGDLAVWCFQNQDFCRD